MLLCYFCCHMTDANPAALFSLQVQPPHPQCQQEEMRYRGAEYCRKTLCYEPDTLVPQVCIALCE